jgi:hypothetical protein
MIEPKICHDAVIAGHLGSQGEMPPCLKEQCSRYYQCKRDEMTARIEIDQLNRHPAHARIFRGVKP